MTKRSSTVLMILGLLLTLAVVLSSGQRSTARAIGTAGVSPQKWEYRVLSVSGRNPAGAQVEADRLGDQGFELIEFNVNQFESTNMPVTYHMVFKRPKP